MTVALPTTNDQLLDALARDLGLPDLQALTYFPKFLSIETTSACNARCIMCPVDTWTREHKLMPQDLFDKIVAELAPFTDWVERVAIPVIGEPLIDKRLEQKIRALKEIGVKTVDIACNAALMTEQRAETLIEAGLDFVDFSIDGATRETFEAIRKQLDFEQCVENIETFLKVRDRLAPQVFVRVRMTVFEANAHEVEAFRAFWSERLGPNDQAYAKRVHTWANWAPHLSLSAEDRAALNARPCVSTWSTMNILTDGRVPLCCCDFNAETNLGNVAQNTLQEIWHGQASARVRAAHRAAGRNGMPQCVDCLAWDSSAKIE